MAGDVKSFKLFLILLVVGGFVIVAAHQYRHDYFGTGRAGFAGKAFSIKEYFVDGATRKQAQQMKATVDSSARASLPDKESKKNADSSAAQAAREEEDDLSRQDRKELGNLLDQVAP